VYAFHPQEELAKFGYRPERKVEKIYESCYIFWRFVFGTYYLNLTILFFKKSFFWGATLVLFFCYKKSFV
jgi:hypothetical protein